MPLRKLFLFGVPRLEQDGQALPLPGRKLPALLAYLAATAQPQSRDLLATLFWSEFDQSTARANLRRELSGLRTIFDATYLKIEREQVSLPFGPDLWLDVAVFQSRLHECQQHPHGTQAVCASCLPLLQEAADLYTADFLAGFSLSACPDFDEWQYFQAEGYRRTLATVLDRLAQGYVNQNEAEAAIAQARRRVSLDPLHEAAQRQLIALYAETGNRTAALRQADLCVQLLQDELGAPPDAETAALIDRLRHSNAKPIRKTSQQAFQQASAAHAPRHNLPIQTTSFIGRTDEVGEIKGLLLDEAGCRLLNLVGPGGIGKTRLALAAAMQAVDAFPDGAFYVPLAPISEVPDIVPAIAEALRFTFYGNRDPKDQLVDYLSRKQLLLVLDNFEHLLAGADLLSAILTQAPDVTLLTTARERLQLQEEWVYAVQGLAFPADSSQNATISENIGPLDTYSAVQLFIHRARQTIATFNPTSDELLAIGRICQLVGGMPLGIELSAPWIRTLRCDEIAAEIARSLDFLTTSLRNVPERHRSLRVVFEQTWRRLSEAEQRVMMQLSVFRGGFTREAAEVVASASLPVLSSLMNKALVRRTNLGHYELHDLTRQFALEKLWASGSSDGVRARHEAYFIALSEEELQRLRVNAYHPGYFSHPPVSNQIRPVAPSRQSPCSQRSIRVLMLSPEYPPHVQSGIGKHVAELVSALGHLLSGNKNLFVDLLAPCFTGEEYIESINPAVTIHHVCVPTLTERPYNHLQLLAHNSLLVEYANKLLQQHRYDLLHVQEQSVSQAGLALKEHWQLPLITTLHHTSRGRNLYKSPNTMDQVEQLEQQMCNSSAQIIVTSQFMQQELRQYLAIPYERIRVVANGIRVQEEMFGSTEELATLRKQYAPLAQKLLMFIGHTTYEKGLLTLIRAMPGILAAHPDTYLLVASKYGDKLRPLVYELNVEDAVFFLGYVSNHQRDRLYQIVDAVIIPSLYEPFGIVALEAMALNCNVIASDVGGLREVIKHQYTGLLISPNDPESIVQTVNVLFADPVAAQQRRMNAIHELGTVYRWDKIAAQTAKIYESIVLNLA